MRSGRGPKTLTKIIENWRPWTIKNNDFSLEGLQKSLFSAFSKNLTKCLRKCVRNCATIYKMPLWMHCRKTTNNNAKNNANCTKNHPRRVSHERGFRIPVLLKTTFYLHASSFFNMSYIFTFFLTFFEHLEIAVLLAWELTFREM